MADLTCPTCSTSLTGSEPVAGVVHCRRCGETITPTVPPPAAPVPVAKALPPRGLMPPVVMNAEIVDAETVERPAATIPIASEELKPRAVAMPVLARATPIEPASSLNATIPLATAERTRSSRHTDELRLGDMLADGDLDNGRFRKRSSNRNTAVIAAGAGAVGLTFLGLMFVCVKFVIKEAASGALVAALDDEKPEWSDSGTTSPAVNDEPQLSFGMTTPIVFTPPATPITMTTMPATPPPTRPLIPTFPPPTAMTTMPVEPPAPPPPPRPVLATKIEPFLCAVELPGRNEVLTFAPRVDGRKAAGIARRYSLPKFELIESYPLAAPVTHAAIDPQGTRLAVAAVTRPDPAAAASDPTERIVSLGDVQVYSLAEFLKDPAEPGTIPPMASVRFPSTTRIAGVELGAEGQTGYATLISHAGTTRGRVWKSRVVRFDPATGKLTGTLELPGPVWQSIRDAKGEHLYLADQVIAANGLPVLVPGVGGRSGGLTIVELGEFRILPNPARLTGPVVDLTHADDRVLAACLTPVGVRLVTVDSSGSATDATPPEWQSAPAGSIAWSGGRLAASTRGGAGVTVYTAASLDQPDRYQLLGLGREYEGSPVGGRFVAVASGKFGVFQSGMVLDFTKTELTPLPTSPVLSPLIPPPGNPNPELP